MDPIARSIHYVGTTDYPERRFHLHRTKAVNGGRRERDTSQYYKWFARMIRAGTMPEMYVSECPRIYTLST